MYKCQGPPAPAKVKEKNEKKSIKRSVKEPPSNQKERGEKRG